MRNYDLDGLEYVTASLSYLKPTSQKPAFYVYDPPADARPAVGELLPRTVRIRSGRPISASLSLDEQGFALVQRPTAVGTFDDDEIVRSYYPEVEQLVKETVGATKVVISAHAMRSSDSKGDAEPVWRVHADYTPKSACRRARNLLEAEEAATRLNKRFMVVGVWRPIGGPVRAVPLAVCDARSVAPQDLVATELLFPVGNPRESYSLTFNPGHRWFYFPLMRNDEVMLLKLYDSLNDGRARFAPHAAFVDPTTPANAPCRRSIEMRVFAFFDDPLPGPHSVSER